MAVVGDHLIYLTESLSTSLSQFHHHGFSIIQGGRHSGSVTENALVVLNDRNYIEVISFVPSDDPEILAFTPEELEQWQVRRIAHNWYGKKEGWIDWAVGPGQEITDEFIRDLNARLSLAEDGAGEDEKLRKFEGPKDGGRLTKDGIHIKWRLATGQVGRLPFFCEDVTPREWRVRPPSPPHQNGVGGLAEIILLSLPSPSDSERYRKALSVTLNSSSSSAILLPSPSLDYPPVKISINPPTTAPEQEWVLGRGSGIYRVDLYKESGGEMTERLPGIWF